MIKFKLNAVPFSINKAYYKNGGKTKACRDWQDKILINMQKVSIQQQITKLLSRFDPLKHGLSVTYRYFQPDSVVLTKGGELSRRGQDLSNVEKLLQDLLFDSRYNGRTIYNENARGSKLLNIRNFNLDDKFICDLKSEKRISSPAFAKNKQYYIEIEMDIVLTANLHKED